MVAKAPCQWKIAVFKGEVAVFSHVSMDTLKDLATILRHLGYLTATGLDDRNLVKADNCSVGMSGQSVVIMTGILFARCTIFFWASVGFISTVSVNASVPLGRYSSSLLGIGPV